MRGSVERKNELRAPKKCLRQASLVLGGTIYPRK